MEIFPMDDFFQFDVFTNSLPKENKALYERFPELKKYQEWRMVKLYFGNYPTKEEISKLFVDKSKLIQ